MKFKSSDLPCVDVGIEGKSYPLVVDLGSRLEMVVFSEVLGPLPKKPYGTEKWKNFRGTDYEYPTYLLPKVEVGSFLFKKAIVAEFPTERDKEHVIWSDATQEKKSSDEIVGYLGRGLLKKVNLLLDVKRSKLVMTNSPTKLKSDGYDLAAFEKVPFDLAYKGMVIEADTDLGKVRLLLDTGCTWTMLHEYLYPKDLEKKISRYGFPMFTSSQFKMNGIDFGDQMFYFIDITKELSEFDGFLGMDFIKNHVMYIDFAKKLLYIQK
ncbi:MAG: hypothetical protein KDK76_06875 [Chlamydiia bacterium]|nr:hypothetical protein [Chlamydiia bacterium]